MGRAAKTLLKLLIFIGVLTAGYFFAWQPWAGQRLVHAVKTADFQEAQYLLVTGIDVNTRGENGFSALHHAAMWCFHAMAELLVRNGADVNIRDNWGGTPLHRAVSYNCKDTAIIKFLVFSGGDVNAKSDRGYTPLHNAAEGFLDAGHTRIPMIKLLIELGADLNATTPDLPT